MRMGVVKALTPTAGGSSRGSIVGTAGQRCPVRLLVLGSHRAQRLPRAAAAPRESGLLLPRGRRRQVHRAAVLEQRTNAYKASVRRFTDEHGIPILQAPP